MRYGTTDQRGVKEREREQGKRVRGKAVDCVCVCVNVFVAWKGDSCREREPREILVKCWREEKSASWWKCREGGIRRIERKEQRC